MGYHREWKQFYERGKFIIVPRGYGRNSYRLGEVLQMGMVSVYVYSDLIWLPYYDSINWSSFAIVARWDKFNETFDRIQQTSVETLREMRMAIRKLYPTHFSVGGQFEQIMRLLRFGFAGSDLRCAKYSSLKDEPGTQAPPARSRGLSTDGKAWAAGQDERRRTVTDL
jgi:hypothetical protein